ncbi:MAG: cysteine--tRNA ligase [Candidatus Omnitrophica bacterium]|nr:cysteine--tRNA ligase [Candidatus Omnitrophota bacterium]
MSLHLYNTLTRRLEEFRPLDPKGKRVGIYVCGPTVYDIPHIGHARSAYVFDVLRRYLVFKGYQVKFVRNVTDVDDKIIDKARQEFGERGTVNGERDLKATCREISERYLKSYHEAMDRLGIARPDVEPKATEHVVPDMTDFISKLLMSGTAYEAGGDVYFAVRKSEGYGRLSNRSLDELQAGARVEPGEHKQDPLDFALWKAAKPEEPSWPSPWGAGRPGWHIECSVMSTKELGDTFDIHGGGVDLVFPHHENEIAQARGAGKPFARTWIHNGLLTVNGEKMSKSLGNFITVEQALKDWPHPDYVKLFFLKTHYRSPIDFSHERMGEAKRNWEEFSRFVQHYYQRCTDAEGVGPASGESATGRQAFEAAMDDDLNTPKALAALFELVNAGHRMLEAADASAHGAARSVFDTLMACGAVLGLFQHGLTEEEPTTRERIDALIAKRDAARKAKNFKQADDIRESLQQEGVLLADTAGGTLWRRTR